MLQCVHVPATAVSLLIIAKHGCQASIYTVSAYWFSFLIFNRKGWRLDLKGTKRVLSPQSRSGKGTLNFNVILFANLTSPFRSEVHIQTKGAANFVAICWSESFCLEHFKQCSFTTLSPCTHWIYSVMVELTRNLQRK